MQAAAPAGWALLTASERLPWLSALRVGNLRPQRCGEHAEMKRSQGGPMSISWNHTLKTHYRTPSSDIYSCSCTQDWKYSYPVADGVNLGNATEMITTTILDKVQTR